MSVKSASACIAVLLALLWWNAPRAADADKDEGKPGWLATFSSPDGKASDARADRLVALHVPAGGAAMPMLPAGPFRATWAADLSLELKGEYTFSATGQGKVRVTADGAEVFAAEGDLSKTRAKPVTLKRGVNKVVVTYDSPAKGDAFLRLLWESDEFPPEPIPLALVRHAPTKALDAANVLRRGREAVTNRRCLACHQADTASWLKAGGMPELEMDTPSLADVGARLHPGWVARWLHDPQSLRPGANMPRPFPDAARGEDAKLDPRVRDLAAYLATLGKPGPAPKGGDKEAGLRLFARLGCIGCHLAPDKEEMKDDMGRLPLRDVSAKWRPDALVAFLRQPDRHYSWVRMPNFQLTADEASNLAAYLLGVKARAVFPAKVEGDAAAGKKLAASAGCVNCHAVEGKPATHAKAPAWAKIKGAACKAVDFGLSGEEKAGIGALLAASDALGRDTPAEFAARQLVSMRCNACHKRDGVDDLWTQLKEENEGLTADLEPTEDDKSPRYSVDQARPALTWVGEKLKPEWTAALLAGKLAKPRPFLKSRMPAFPRRSALLAHGLAAEHGCPPSSPPDPAPDAKLAEVGREMSGKGKWGCVGCHMVGASAAVGVFEAPGVNFDMVKDRLRRDYFDRWMWAPLRVEPGTKMPTVYTWRKPSPLEGVLGGSAARQIDALWAYTQTGKKIKPPE